jgi:hypothetical protein
MSSGEETIVRKSEPRDRSRAPLRGKFLCECGSSFCAEHLLLTAAEYSVRCTCGRRLVIAPGHEGRWDWPTKAGLG